MSQFTQISSFSITLAVSALLAACSSDRVDPTNSLAVKQTTLTEFPIALPSDDAASSSYSTKTLMVDHMARMAEPTIAESAADHSYTDVLSSAKKHYSAFDTSGEGETYAHYPRNSTQQTQNARVSTISIDVDTGSYSNMRRFLESGALPPADAIRVEELVNYFSYNYPNDATIDQPFSVNTEIAPSPWNENTHLLKIGLAGYTPTDLHKKSANLVFLIDVSGSMDSPHKLGLLKSSISMLSDELDENDTISIVVYAGSSGTILKATKGDQTATIHRALSQLTAGGSTNGAAGIELAYRIASENVTPNSINRVILATDGDFNVGISDVDTLKKLIALKRKSGIALTTLGFGRGNYNDHLMEQLAQEGNGNYAYIDKLSEAKKVLVDELSASLVTIAKDVKVQVEFNPATVSEYRLIGYTNRILANEDFDNDKVDAGEIGAGHTVTALYEIALKGFGGEKHSANRYAQEPDLSANINTKELANLRLRYKLPNSIESRLISTVISKNDVKVDTASITGDFSFAASVAAFGQLLSDNESINMDYGRVKALALSGKGEDTFGYRQEFIRLIDIAHTLEKIDNAALHENTVNGNG